MSKTSEMFCQRFEEGCRMIHRTQSSVCDELGIARSSASRWKAGMMPRYETIQRLATVLNVSPAWLQGIDGAERIPVIIATPELTEITRIFNTLDFKGRVQLLNFAYELEEKKK